MTTSATGTPNRAGPDVAAAEKFLAASARVLERRRYEHLFRGGGAEPVRAAILAYRNPDGGFGHALEPDGRCPGSQSLATDFALHTLLDTGAWDSELALAACDWLAKTAPPEGGTVFVAPSIEAWPHAPWLDPADQSASLICTALLAGTMHAGGVSHPWVDGATALVWQAIDELSEPGPYDMRALLWFLEHAPERDRAERALDRICPMIFDLGLVALDPQTPGEVHFPLDFAPLPTSPARRFFTPQVIGAQLDHLVASQLADGGWTFNWLAWSPAAELEWRGHMTVEALRVLRAHGRC
jgi:hypothetical protein